MSVEHVNTPYSPLRRKRWKGQRVRPGKERLRHRKSVDVEETSESDALNNAETPDCEQCDVLFEANTSYGLMGVRASMVLQGEHGRDMGEFLHAMVLGLIEEHIQFFENWLRCPLDLHPAQDSAPHYKAVATVSQVNGEESEAPSLLPRVTVFLPVSVWRLIPEFDQQLLPSGMSIAWENYDSQVILSHLSLGAKDMQALQEGSLVLCPDSYGKNWSSSLMLEELGVVINGYFDAVSCVFNINKQAVVDQFKPSEEATAVIRFSSQQSENRDGDYHSARICFSMNLSVASVLRFIRQYTLQVCSSMQELHVTLKIYDSSHWQGALSPLSDGYVMYLESREQAEPQRLSD